MVLCGFSLRGTQLLYLSILLLSAFGIGISRHVQITHSHFGNSRKPATIFLAVSDPDNRSRVRHSTYAAVMSAASAHQLKAMLTIPGTFQLDMRDLQYSTAFWSDGYRTPQSGVWELSDTCELLLIVLLDRA